MEEITENVLFDRQLPCVVCGLPTNCGTAISAEVKGLEDYDFKGTWVIYPICERNTGCRERMQDAGMIPKPGEKLTLHQNNGLVEGKVNKLKLIKRMGYGRAGFPLLRQRVLHAL